VLSNYSKRQIEEIGLDAAVIPTPPNFGVHKISEEHKKQLDKKYGTGKNILANIGWINWQKDYGILSECLNYVDSDVEIRVVGQNLDILSFRNNVKRGKASLRFFSSREEVSDYEMSYLFQNAHALVLAYRPGTFFCQSGWPSIALEHGTSVIYPRDTGAISEYVGDAGIQIELDPKALAYAIDSIVMNDGLRSRLKQRALERSKLFTWDDTARKTLEVYKSIAD
jgi:glycosyltransferase involved in cell wall biosynthesis